MKHHPPSSASNERIFNLPIVVTRLLVVMAAIQLAAQMAPASLVAEVYGELAFVPARISFLLAPDAVMRAFADTLGPGLDRQEVAVALDAESRPWWTFVTYALLHGGWTHLAINAVMLAAFGSPLARRIGTPRFLAFLAVTAVAGAAVHLAVHPFDLAPVVGASAAVSGTIAASARFAFGPGAPLGEPWASPRSAGGASSLGDLLANRRALTFLALWFGLNLLFGVFPRAAGSGEQIAWEAHVGGFAAGLLLFGAFDRRRATGD